MAVALLFADRTQIDVIITDLAVTYSELSSEDYVVREAAAGTWQRWPAPGRPASSAGATWIPPGPRR